MNNSMDNNNIKRNRMGSKLKKRNKNNQYKISYIFICIFSLLWIFSLIKIMIWYYENSNSKKILNEVLSHIVVNKDVDNDIENKKIYQIDFEELKKINTDIFAWIKVDGTNIEYPIVMCEDNNFYLKNGFDKKKNSAGAIFLDYRNSISFEDDNTIIYGHNRKDGSMFGNLKNVLSDEWFLNKENRKIIVVTENEEIVYEIFSVYKIEREDYYIQIEIENKNEFIDTLMKRSERNFGINVSEKDKILTLSTCDNNNIYRVVLHAKKLNNE